MTDFSKEERELIQETMKELFEHIRRAASVVYCADYLRRWESKLTKICVTVEHYQTEIEKLSKETNYD